MITKENRAITLVALVITIVVLIILAAVAINLSLEDNGIFNRAKTAKEQYQNAQDYEETQIAKYTNEINSYFDGNRDTVTMSKDEYNTLINRIKKLEDSKYIVGAYSASISGGNLYIPNNYGTDIKVFVNVVGSYSGYPWVCNTVISQDNIYCAIMNSDWKWFNGTINVQYIIIPNEQ